MRVLRPPAFTRHRDNGLRSQSPRVADDPSGERKLCAVVGQTRDFPSICSLFRFSASMVPGQLGPMRVFKLPNSQRPMLVKGSGTVVSGQPK